MKKDFIFKEINFLKGVGPQLSRYLKRKKIEKIKDIILNLPYSETDRSKIFKLSQLEVGKVQSIKVLVKKHFLFLLITDHASTVNLIMVQ